MSRYHTQVGCLLSWCSFLVYLPIKCIQPNQDWKLTKNSPSAVAVLFYRPYAHDVISVRHPRLEVKRRLFIGQCIRSIALVETTASALDLALSSILVSEARRAYAKHAHMSKQPQAKLVWAESKAEAVVWKRAYASYDFIIVVARIRGPDKPVKKGLFRSAERGQSWPCSCKNNKWLTVCFNTDVQKTCTPKL